MSSYTRASKLSPTTCRNSAFWQVCPPSSFGLGFSWICSQETLDPSNDCTATFMPRVRRFLSHLRCDSDWHVARAPTGLSEPSLLLGISTLCTASRLGNARLPPSTTRRFFASQTNSCGCHMLPSRAIISLERVAKLVPVPTDCLGAGLSTSSHFPFPKLFRLSPRRTSPHKCVS